MIKKDTVVIRITPYLQNGNIQRPAGKFEITLEDNIHNYVIWKKGLSLGQEHYRFPTQQELAWHALHNDTILDMPTYVKGGIYVRTTNAEYPTASVHGQIQGDMIVARNNSKFCYYTETTHGNASFRPATELECKEYEKGMRNVLYSETLPDSFIIIIDENADLFREMLRHAFNSKGYTGKAYAYHLVKNENHYSLSNAFTSHQLHNSLFFALPIVKVSTFIQSFNNPIKTKENGADVSGQNIQDRGSKIVGTTAFASKAKPNAIRSRLAGNRVSINPRQTRVGKCVISFSAKLSANY